MIRRLFQNSLIAAAFLLVAGARSEIPHLPGARNTAEILSDLHKLNTLGSVLYVAAHPDDENTRLIAYLSKKMKLDVGYLSLTRGDGGQNLIGPELRESLGVIRTQELLAARETDGGRQFFSRAIDFGYSKSAEETLRFWDDDAVLSDMVWVIRRFQPDVIVTRFSTEGGGTHGHHTASAILAVEAFSAAADSTRFADQLQYVDTWQAKRIVWNGGRFFFRGRENRFEEMGFVSMDVGGYDPLLGRSYGEIAAASRSMHKSQGFGSAPNFGVNTEYFQLLDGAGISDSIFDDVETSWKRLDPSGGLSDELGAVIDNFASAAPADSLPSLLTFRSKLIELEKSRLRDLKLGELDRIIASVLGLHVQARANSRYVSPGESMNLELRALKRAEGEVAVREWSLSFEDRKRSIGRALDNNRIHSERISVQLPSDHPISQPYWLRSEGTIGMFEVVDQLKIGRPENEAAVFVAVVFDIEGQEITYEIPVVRVTVSPVHGEVVQPVVVSPSIAVSLDRSVQLFPNFEAKEVEVTVTSREGNGSGAVRLELPEGWSARPEKITLRFDSTGPQRVSFQVIPPSAPSQGKLSAVVEVGGRRYSRGRSAIDYDHFPEQTLFPVATAKIATDSIRRLGERIGYLEGAGDSIPESLQEIGYEVERLNIDELDSEGLSNFDAVVVGIRAFNTIQTIEHGLPTLWSYAESGGVVIVQYNTNRSLKADALAPYSLTLSRDRITDETAPVSILKSDHPALSVPNKIGLADFDGWTQERGLYFPRQWSDKFEALIESSDSGERPLKGGLLVAEYGEGYFVYTSYSWFRQLPAGVPGAYRIFANLVSLGSHE